MACRKASSPRSHSCFTNKKIIWVFYRLPSVVLRFGRVSLSPGSRGFSLPNKKPLLRRIRNYAEQPFGEALILQYDLFAKDFFLFHCKLFFFLFVMKIGRQKDQIRTQTDGGNIKKRADVPAEFLGDLLEHRQGRIFRTDEEHIDGAVRCLPKDQIDGKRNGGKNQKNDGCRAKLFFRFRKAPRSNQIRAHEDQEHMPDKGVQGQRPIFMHNSRGLNERHDASQQIICGHKAVHPALNVSFFQKRGENTKIHGYAAKLEREDPPLVMSVSDVVIVKKLLINFCEHEKDSDAEQNDSVPPIAEPPQSSRQ